MAIAPAPSRPEVEVPPADVVFGFFSGQWASAPYRGFTEDRLVLELHRNPAVGRLLICEDYRSVARRLRSLAARNGEQGPELRAGAALHRPTRVRRRAPADPSRTVARYEAGMRRAARRLGLRQPAVITAHPLVAGLGRFEWARSVTYVAWDDWAASEPHRRWWPAYAVAFERLRVTGRRVCAVSQAALDRVAPTGPHAVIPNGIEPEEWLSPGRPPAWFAAAARPRLLYVGSLDGRIDVGQLAAVARAFPGGSVTLVGSLLDPEHLRPLRELPNVDIRPLVPRTEVPGLVAAADVCLIPHLRTPLTEAMSPLKLYEYLAGGRPVAAVDLPPIRTVGGRVVLVPAGGDFVPTVRRALELGPASEPERLAFVAEHAWSRRLTRLMDLALAP